MTVTLIENGWVIPMAGDQTIIACGAVAYDENGIIAAGAASDMPDGLGADIHIDATGKVVMPGLVNTHIHLPGAYNKAITEDITGSEAALFKRALPLQVRYVNQEDAYWGALVHGLEALKTGTTTVNEMFWHQPSSIRAVQTLGMRGVMCELVRGVRLDAMSADSTKLVEDDEAAAAGLQRTRDLHAEWHGAENGRISICCGPAGADMLMTDHLVACRELAEELGLRTHIHLSDVPGHNEKVIDNFGQRPVPYLREHGVLGPETIVIHAVYLDDDDIAGLAETGTKMSHTPFLVSKRGIFPPIDKVYAAGIDVALGTDWCSNDLWKFMRHGITIPRVLTGDQQVRDGMDLLTMATIGGARCLGLDDQIGSLEPGKKADIVLLDVMTPWCQPIRDDNLITNIVYNANGSDVTDVIVDSRRVVEDRKLTVADEAEILAETQSRADRIWTEAAALFED